MRTTLHLVIGLFSVGIGTLAASCAVTRPAEPPPAPRAAAGAGGDLADEVHRFGEDSDFFNRFYSVRWSDPGLKRQESFLTERLDGMSRIDFSALETPGKVDYLLLRNEIRSAISRNQLAQRQLAEMDATLAVRSVILPLEEARTRMEKIDPKACAAELSRIPEMIKTTRERLDRGRKAKDGEAKTDAITLTPVVAQRAASALGSLNGTMRSWFDFHDGFEPAFSWWCAKPYEEARKSIEDLARYLREDLAGVRGKPDDPLIGDPIGREALLADLRTEFVAYNPEELIEIGEREFAWCEIQMKAAAKEMGLGDDWKAALTKVKLNACDPGEQAAYVSGLAREAIAFVKDNDLVTVPPLCEQLWRTTMLSPQQQRTLPFAVYFPQAMGVAYATSDMAHDDKVMAMRGNNRHFTRIVTPHELIPGHHLQGYMAARERAYRRRFSTSFFVEGWALYWEMKLWDLHWAKGPEDRIGMLFWRMHRCARIMVSLKFHLGQMKPAEMVDYLVDRVGHERANATAEVRRFIGGDYSPLYQCGYMIGGKQLRALHEELVVRGGMKERAFNDAVLHEGPIPIELLRAAMAPAAANALTPTSEPAWRFGEGK